MKAAICEANHHMQVWKSQSMSLQINFQFQTPIGDCHGKKIAMNISNKEKVTY